MLSLGDSISGMLKAYGLSDSVQRHRAVVVWEEVIGPAINKHIKTVELKGRVLVVKTSSPAWRTELAFQKDELLRTINNKIGSQVIRDIRFS